MATANPYRVVSRCFTRLFNYFYVYAHPLLWVRYMLLWVRLIYCGKPILLCRKTSGWAVFSVSVAQSIQPPSLKPPSVNIKEVLQSVILLIDVEYQSNSVIVLRADELPILLTNGTMSPFWNAIDLVKNYGYSLNDVTTSGMGSQGNPTRFYAIMSKP